MSFPLVRTVTLGLWAGWALAGDAPPARTSLTLEASGTTTQPSMLGYTLVHAKKGTEIVSIPFATADGKLRFAKKIDGWLVDRNGDGILNDQDLPLINTNGNFTVPVRLAGGIKPYPMHVLQAQPEYIYLTSCCTLDATIGTTRLRLVDRNMDGRFDELGRDGVMAGSKRGLVLPLTHIISLGDRLVEVAVVDDSAALTGNRTPAPAHRSQRN